MFLVSHNICRGYFFISLSVTSVSPIRVYSTVTLIDEQKFFCQSLRKSHTNERVCHFYVICGVKLTRLAAPGIPHVNVVMLGDVQSIGSPIAIDL